MAWITQVGDFELDSDDLTLEELDQVEKATGVAWSLLNPWRDVNVAKEFIRIAYVRSGLEPAHAEAKANTLRGRDIRSAFDFRQDEPLGDGDGEESEVPLDQSSQSSSDGASGGSAGPRRKRGSSA